MMKKKYMPSNRTIIRIHGSWQSVEWFCNQSIDLFFAITLLSALYYICFILNNLYPFQIQSLLCSLKTEIQSYLFNKSIVYIKSAMYFSRIRTTITACRLLDIKLFFNAIVGQKGRSHNRLS